MIIVGLISSLDEKDDLDEVVKISLLSKRFRSLPKKYKGRYLKEREK
jgi:hypothetical protein